MNKISKKWLIPIIFTILLLSSCDKYLGVDPKGKRLLKTVTDFELWLESEFLQTQIPVALNDLGDTRDNKSLQNPPGINDWMYTWQEQFTNDPKSKPVLWADLYQAVYYYNTVLLGIDEATGGTDLKKLNIKAEALLGRAFTYLYLVNLYGKSYNPSTATSDLAVPFVTSNDLGVPTPGRSSVKEIYNHIINDLNESIQNLPLSNKNNRFRGSQAAAYSVLARTYLYMGDYVKAAQNAQLAIEKGEVTMVNYSTMAQASLIPQLKRAPDAIYARYNSGRGSPNFPTTSLLKSYNIHDKRLNFFNSNNPVFPNLGGYVFAVRGQIMYWPGGITTTGNYSYPNCGTSITEMKLILAEAAARANDLTKACNELDDIRKCRIAPAGYVKFTSNDKETVLNAILKERVYEYPFHGLRWFDMRRLDAEGRMPEVKRYSGNDEVVATLSPGSDRYTLQIPISVMYFNPDWPQNP